MIYFFADTHFNHKNICRGTSQWSQTGGTRDYDTLDAMNADILYRINRMVTPDDTLYHLGDFAFGDKDEIPTLRKRINCRDVRLIIGNHDQHYVKKRPELYKGFSSIVYYKEIRYNKLLISMMHYPLGSWNEIGRGGINLYGHCHSNYTRAVGRQMDVGFDAIVFPISIEELYDRMIKIPVQLVDGHNEETNYG